MWDTDTRDATQKLIFSSEPLVSDNLVYATFFEPGSIRDLSRCGLAALRADSGELQWTRYFGTGNSGIFIAEKLRQ